MTKENSAVGAQHEAVIKKVVLGAKGMAEVEGKVCFVEGVLPGERVRIEITGDKGNFYVGKPVEIIEPSAERSEPPCPYVSHCGGCQYQHMSYPAELKAKTDQIKEHFEHHLKTDPAKIDDIRHHGDGYRYRGSVTLRPAGKAAGEAGRLGFVARDNASAVVVNGCLLADEKLQPWFMTNLRIPKDKKRVTFSVGKDGNVVNSLKENLYHLNLEDKGLWASSDGFFQNNRPVTELVIKQVREWIEKIAPFGLFDLYAGVGTFGLLCARKVVQLTLIEESRVNLECLQLNLEALRQNPCRVIRGRVEDRFPRAAADCVPAEFAVFMDPPRGGVHPQLAQFLSEHGPFKSIIYLSCDPATLVRDLKIITGKGRYKIEEVIPFDMFPRTRHIETLALLKPVA